MTDTATIERLAREAGLERDGESWFTPSPDPLDTFDVSTESLTRFAELIEAQMKERCAAVVDANAQACDRNSVLESVLSSNAAAIRAL